MKFENTKVMNFENALRGMRNPKNSWDKSDTVYGFYPTMSIDEYNKKIPKDSIILSQKGGITEYIKIGDNDLRLAQSLIKAGSEHRKFMRQMFVSVDITAALYWWKEMDQYKVGTTTNSTSTMHKLADTPITKDCFEMDDFVGTESASGQVLWCSWTKLILTLEMLRKKYNETKDKAYWKELIRLLPESWLQTRTFTCNYENLLAMCSRSQRRYHKLNEWSGKDNPDVPNFISWARTLPYAKELLFLDEEGNNGGK